ncbi:hypothetical protein FisN_24Lh097 [Fistulifera solaris]|uniref:D-alanine--D-alanine ligase n=1 Tax=Fistulifera solaris TaxID=1519565 RepID=A0A1Z5K9J6_FISSO|nr:hypothetical protein FisN_24Lh097 [Fistulifera solaris]|eukprot:GAX22815.1 hypothetical protein FisN_24Lh097 [Fistulifera solaris]
MSLPKRLCVLTSDKKGCEYDENDPPADIQQHLQRAGYENIDVQVVSLTPHNYARTLIALARRFQEKEIDCFINLCDGAWDEPSVGIQVVDLLEDKLNVPFTGAGMSFFEPTRMQMKQVALACGVSVPAWRFVYHHDDLRQLVTEYSASSEPLSFPLLVKHFSSYASVGLTKESKVHNVHDLEKQCQRMLETYGGCLVEEFIVGREFTVLVAQAPSSQETIEVVAYEPVECRFGEGEDFKHYNLKWVDYDNITWTNVRDPDLAERLKTLACKVFAAIGGRGYGRLDVRSDLSGEKLVFLEINPNCGVFYPEGFYGSADFILDKMDPVAAHATFILNQVEVARRLWEKRNAQVSEARYDPLRESWGIYATKELEPGDLIFDLEEKPLHVVSKQRVLQQWRKRNDDSESDFDMRNWDNFGAYCWPLSDELFGMWSPEPDDWRPINHSCDPNCWLEAPSGLNVVAKKRIAVGEEICMDYATFVGYFPEMKPFTCGCKTSYCRGTITGQDILNVDLARKYYGHMTSYTAAKAKEYHGHELIGVDGTNAVSNYIQTCN